MAKKRRTRADKIKAAQRRARSTRSGPQQLSPASGRTQTQTNRPRTEPLPKTADRTEAHADVSELAGLPAGRQARKLLFSLSLLGVILLIQFVVWGIFKFTAVDEWLFELITL